MKTQTPLDQAIQHLGGLESSRQALGLRSYQVLQQWRKNRVPAEYCPLIEQLTGGAVRCEQLRPDVNWGFIRATDCPGQRCTKEAA